MSEKLKYCIYCDIFHPDALFFIIDRFYVNLLKYEPQEAILPWNQHIKSLQKNKKNFRPTDPNIFRHVSGNTGISSSFLGLNVRKFWHPWNWSNWAASWQNQQNDMCAQRRFRSAWASAQSDQSSLCALWVAKDPVLLHADREDSD